MRLESDSLMQDLIVAAHKFIGGRFSTVILILILLHIGFFVYGFGQRTPDEPLNLVNHLSLTSARALDEPHRIISSVFVYTSFWQLVFTVFALYLCGWFVLRRLGIWLFLLAYFLSAAVTNVTTHELVGVEHKVAGASGGAIGLIFLCAAYFPYLRFFNVIPAKYLAPALICIGAFAGAPYIGAIVVVAQLAGVSVTLFVFLLEPRIRTGIRKWWLHKQVESAINEAQEEEKLDILLKKVSTTGMAGLSRKERNFLIQMSKRYHKKATERKE